MAADDLGLRVTQLERAIDAFAAELRLAFRYIHSDAASSLTKSRLVMEKLLLKIYTTEMGKEPRKPLLGEMLADNQFTRIIERRILARMNAIRDMGNLGPHGEPVEPRDAAKVLDDLCEVLDWYLRRYNSRVAVTPDEFPTAEPPTGIPVEEAGSTALPTRRFLGEYELLDELGRGGMSIVYRAWQPATRRPVAVKRLFVPGNRSAEGRFRREIEALGQVQHPHLVKIYTSGCDGDQWYYVMELIDGVPLSAVCQKLAGGGRGAADVDVTSWQTALSTVHEEARGNQTKSARDHVAEVSAPAAAKTDPEPSPAAAGCLGYFHQVVELMIQTAEAAATLHQHGILHRDIKPSNILLDAAGRHATLMDLGLAKFLDRTDDPLTRTRGFVGTVRYASPEQVLALGDLDARSDVYSLGATLWELLTLQPIHGAHQLSERRLMRQIVYKPVDRVRRHNPNVPPDLDVIVQRALERDPDDRYATATDLVKDLRNWLDGKPVIIPRRTLGQRAFRFLKRNRLKVVAASMLVIILAIGAVVWTFWPEPADTKEVAKSSGEKQTSDADLKVPARTPRPASGIRVVSFTKDSRAQKAGLKENDVITKVNGEAIHSDVFKLTNLLRSNKDRAIPVEYWSAETGQVRVVQIAVDSEGALGIIPKELE